MEVEDIIISAFFVAILASSILCMSAGAFPYSPDIVRTLAIAGICAYLFNGANIF